MGRRVTLSRSQECAEKAAELERYANSRQDQSTRHSFSSLAYSWRLIAESYAWLERYERRL